jgi:hypothetical protein
VVVEKENIIAAGAIIAKSTQEKDIWLPARSSRSEKKSNEIKF